jgi:excisionase family DNA binding protein
MEPIESPPPLPPDAWITYRTAAARLDLSERTIRRLIREGRIEAKSIGPRCVRIRWASCIRLLEQDGFEGEV